MTDEEKYVVGDIIYDTENKEKVKVLYGPFNKQYAYFYEVENSNNQVYRINAKNTKPLDRFC